MQSNQNRQGPFRAEILNKQRPSLGTVVLARPLTYYFLTIIFAAIALTIVIFFAFFSYTKKVQLSGVLIPKSGIIAVSASQAGTMSKRFVSEGDFVRKGQALFLLSSDVSSNINTQTSLMVSKLLGNRKESFVVEQNQLRLQTTQRIEAADRRINDLRSEIATINDQIELQKRRVSLSATSLGRLTNLQEQNFVSTAQVQDKQGELLDQQQRLADLERGKSSIARDLASTQSSLRDLQLQSLRDHESAARNIAALDQELTEKDARRETMIIASSDGLISTITGDVNQPVNINQTLAVLLPSNTPLVAEVFAPSRAAGFIKPGMDVFIRYQAFPFQKFGQHSGRVIEVSDAAVRSTDYMVSNLASNNSAEPLYRIRLELDKQAIPVYGRLQPLKSGMVIDASVLLEKRRLYEWVLDPLYTVSGRL